MIVEPLSSGNGYAVSMKNEEPRMITTTRHHALTPNSPVAVMRAMARQFVAWASRRRQRLDLDELDDRLLSDIGLTREAARREAEKPFWRR